MIDETIKETREMQMHSSSVVAIKATRMLAELTECDYATVEEFECDLERNVGALERTNPSHASLYNALQDALHSVRDEADDPDEARELTLLTIDRVVETVETDKRHVAQQAAAIIEDGQTFLTHDYSSTIMETAELTIADDMQLITYVTEARPCFLGRKLVRELAAIDDIEPHLMVDGTSEMFLLGCDRVTIGMDCIVEEMLYNRIGTFPFVAAANEAGVLVTAVGSGARIINGGFRFRDETRSSSEVMLGPVENIELENPIYDATSVGLIDEIITDEGVIGF